MTDGSPRVETGGPAYPPGWRNNGRLGSPPSTSTFRSCFHRPSRERRVPKRKPRSRNSSRSTRPCLATPRSKQPGRRRSATQLTDSPVGQAAWIYEKFGDWTESNHDPESVLTREDMLNNISLYWLTSTATSSARLYAESFYTDFSTQ